MLAVVNQGSPCDDFIPPTGHGVNFTRFPELSVPNSTEPPDENPEGLVANPYTASTTYSVRIKIALRAPGGPAGGMISGERGGEFKYGR